MNIRIAKLNVEAFVQSESKEEIWHEVEISDKHIKCSCPDYQFRGVKCKHIQEVENIIQEG